jgi:steroid delta-isomerase-like uncharacterized protein
MSASELLDQFVSTFNDSDWEAGERLVVPGSVSEEVGTGRTFTPQQGTENAKAWKAAFPDARGTIENRIVAGNQAAGEVVWTGTNTGTLNGMPPTGKRVRIRAVVTLREEGGKIAFLRHYIDIAGMMAQLGVTPPAPTSV